MALTQTITTPFGETFPGYYRIIAANLVFTTEGRIRLNMTVDVYSRQEARNAGASAFESVNVMCDFDAEEELPNTRAEYYAWLKTQPGFENATDV